VSLCSFDQQIAVSTGPNNFCGFNVLEDESARLVSAGISLALGKARAEITIER
jgi:hypothetical protein